MCEYKDFTVKYWNYYLSLEERFNNTTRYVELDEANFKTYSNEYVNLLQSIGSEIDVVFKEMLKEEIISVLDEMNNKIKDEKMKKKKSDIENICTYRDIINKYSKYKDLMSIKVKTITKNVSSIPFELCEKNKSPKWWQAYNKIKHNRVIEYKNGNMGNVLYALGGLFVLEMYQFKLIYKKNEQIMDLPRIESQLFYIENWDTEYLNLKGLMMKITGKV